MLGYVLFPVVCHTRARLYFVFYVSAYLWLLASHVQCLCTSPSCLFSLPQIHCGTHNQCYIRMYCLYKISLCIQVLLEADGTISVCVSYEITFTNLCVDGQGMYPPLTKSSPSYIHQYIQGIPDTYHSPR